MRLIEGHNRKKEMSAGFLFNFEGENSWPKS